MTILRRRALKKTDGYVYLILRRRLGKKLPSKLTDRRPRRIKAGDVAIEIHLKAGVAVAAGIVRMP